METGWVPLGVEADEKSRIRDFEIWGLWDAMAWLQGVFILSLGYL